jgi:hypothetical protein
MSASSRASSRSRPSWTPFRAAVLALMVLTLVFRAVSVSRWSWYQDDWLFMAEAHSRPFLDYAFQQDNGHIIPGEYAICWVLSAVAPLSRTGAVVVTAVLATASVGVWAVAFREIFGERLRLLLPLAVLALSPLELRPISWWAAALNLLPLQVFTGLSVLAAALYCRRPSHRNLVWLVVAYVGGLLFWEKAVLILLPVAGVVAFCSRDGVRRTVRWAWPAAASLLTVTAAYLVYYHWATLPGRGRGHGVALENWAGWSDALPVLRDAAVLAWFPGSLGGPWSAARGALDWIPQPGPVTIALSTVAFCVLLAIAVWVRRRAWIPLGMVAAYAFAGVGLVLLSDRVAVLGVGIIRDQRYTADTLVVGCLAVAMLITPSRGEPVPRRRAVPVWLTSRPAWASAAVLVTASLVTGNALVMGRSGSYPGGAWTSNLLADVHRLAPVTVVDDYAPSRVNYAGFAGKDARLARMLSPLHDEVHFGEPATVLYVVGKDGHLRPAEIGASSRAAPGPDEHCGYALTPGRVTQVPMSRKLFKLAWGMQVTAFAGEGGTLVVEAGDHMIRIPIGSGLARHQVAFTGSVADVKLGLTPDSHPLCVTDVHIGLIKAAGGR